MPTLKFYLLDMTGDIVEISTMYLPIQDMHNDKKQSHEIV